MKVDQAGGCTIPVVFLVIHNMEIKSLFSNDAYEITIFFRYLNFLSFCRSRLRRYMLEI